MDLKDPPSETSTEKTENENEKTSNEPQTRRGSYLSPPGLMQCVIYLFPLSHPTYLGMYITCLTIMYYCQPLQLTQILRLHHPRRGTDVPRTQGHSELLLCVFS